VGYPGPLVDAVAHFDQGHLVLIHEFGPSLHHDDDLEIGDVRDYARIRLNGAVLDAHAWQPYRWDITTALQAGSNDLEITVYAAPSGRGGGGAVPTGAVPAGSTVLAEVTVTNAGWRTGDEVAQLYVRETTASVAAPVRSLKGFSRMHLQPGETKALQFHLRADDLAVWGADHKWKLEPGEFTVMVGGSSAADLSTKCVLK